MTNQIDLYNPFQLDEFEMDEILSDFTFIYTISVLWDSSVYVERNQLTQLMINDGFLYLNRVIDNGQEFTQIIYNDRYFWDQIAPIKRMGLNHLNENEKTYILNYIYIIICQFLIYQSIYCYMIRNNIHIEYLDNILEIINNFKIGLTISRLINIFYHNYIIIRERNQNITIENSIINNSSTEDMIELHDLRKQYYIEKRMRENIVLLDLIDTRNISSRMGHIHQIADLNLLINKIDNKLNSLMNE